MKTENFDHFTLKMFVFLLLATQFCICIKASLKGVDAFGKEIGADKIITKLPINIKDCQEVVYISANYIPDLTDYRIKKEAFFNLNVSRISMFESKDPKSLVHSIQFTSLKHQPQLMLGAKMCVEIDSQGVTANMTICLPSVNLAKNLLNAIQTFEKCREGDNLISISAEVANQINKDCNLDVNKQQGEKLNPELSNPNLNLRKAITQNLLNSNVPGS